MHAATCEPLYAASCYDDAYPPSLGAMSVVSHHGPHHVAEPHFRAHHAAPIHSHSHMHVPAHIHAHSHVSHIHAHTHVPSRTVHAPIRTHVHHAHAMPVAAPLRVIGREWREPRHEREVHVVEVPVPKDRVVERVVERPVEVVREVPVPVPVPIKPRARPVQVRRVREVTVEDDCEDEICYDDYTCESYCRPERRPTVHRPPFHVAASRDRSVGRARGGGYYAGHPPRTQRAQSLPRVVRRY